MSGPGMESQSINKRYLTDFAAFLCLLGLVITGLILWLAVGVGPSEEKYFLGWHRHEWGDLHLCFALAFVAVFAIHFIQHWRWIRFATVRQAGVGAARRGAWRLAGLALALLGVVFGAFLLIREDVSSFGQGRQQGRGAAESRIESETESREGGRGAQQRRRGQFPTEQNLP